MTPAVDDRDTARRELVDARTTQILQATARVISARGAAGTRLSDVRREAGVSIGLIQHYFDSKQELMAATFRYCNELWMNEWEAAANAEPDPVRKLLLLLRMSAFENPGWQDVQWQIWIEFWSLASRDPLFHALYPEIYERFHAPFREAVVAGAASGVFAIRGSVDDVVDSLMAEIDGLRVRILLQPQPSVMSPMSRERMLELLVRSAEERLNCVIPHELLPEHHGG